MLRTLICFLLSLAIVSASLPAFGVDGRSHDGMAAAQAMGAIPQMAAMDHVPEMGVCVDNKCDLPLRSCGMTCANPQANLASPVPAPALSVLLAQWRFAEDAGGRGRCVACLERPPRSAFL